MSAQKAGILISPGAVKRMLRKRHQLDMRVMILLDIWNQDFCQFCICMPVTFSPSPFFSRNRHESHKYLKALRNQQFSPASTLHPETHKNPNRLISSSLPDVIPCESHRDHNAPPSCRRPYKYNICTSVRILPVPAGRCRHRFLHPDIAETLANC